MAQIPALASLDDRLTRLEDSNQEKAERLSTHIAEDRINFENIQKNLTNIETKIDTIATSVLGQGEKWVASEASAKTKRTLINWTLTILGIIACSGVLEFFLHNIFG